MVNAMRAAIVRVSHTSCTKAEEVHVSKLHAINKEKQLTTLGVLDEALAHSPSGCAGLHREGAHGGELRSHHPYIVLRYRS
jgi:hypothetical protein